MQRYSINIFIDHSSRILLLRRSEGSDFAPGLWGFCGGKIESDETPMQCSRREAAEELGTGIHYQSMRRLGPISDAWHGGGMRVWLFSHDWLGGDILLNHEHTEYAWVSSRDYPAYPVVRGVDEDLAWLSLWPRDILNADLLPPTPPPE